VIAAKVPQPNTRSNIKVAKPQIFGGITNKMSGFLIVYRLYIRIKIGDVLVEEQVQ